MNLYGNKGSVGIRFEFHQTSFCFLNCHLSAGENSQAFQSRNDQYALIHQRMLFKSPCKKYQWNINDHHGIFFFGDLNYRQTETNHDELKEKTNILKTYSESEIKFPPTYKYKLHSNSYDLSRRSSWTDRILYRNKQCHIQSIDYWTTSMIRFSDHRPIANLFLISRFIR
jgi:phosphatidylinositol-bisphosphatase